MPLHYHSMTIQHFPRALLPVKCSAISRRVNKYSSIVSTLVEYSVLSLSISPESYSGLVAYPLLVKCSALIRRVSPPLYPTLFTFSTQNLQKRKFFCTFAPESYAGGKYVLRKAFRKGSSLGRFRTYLNSVYCALRLTHETSQLSELKVKIKVNSKCLWV